jgi:hypothetical protein
VALGWLWGGFEVALGTHWSRNRLAINRLWGGFDMALGGFAGGPAPNSHDRPVISGSRLRLMG